MPRAAEESDDTSQDSSAISGSIGFPAVQGQANSEDVLMFSRSQLSHVVDFTIYGFAEKRGLPASAFSDFADMVKQALPNAGDIAEDPKDIPQSQVQKMIEVVTKCCLETAASMTKGDERMKRANE